MNTEEINTGELGNNLSDELHHLASEIKISWIRDTDKTDAMKKLTKILTDILNKYETLEDAFNQDEKLLQYFMTEFIEEVINNILQQTFVYGKNGDDIALELLYTIYKFILKYHQNTKYSPLFERIREIVNTSKSNFFFFKRPSHQRNQALKIDNPKKRLTFNYFNHKFCSDFLDEKKEEENIFKEGQNIDVLIKYERSRTQLDKKAWVRGTIKSVDKEKYIYIIESPELDSEINVQIGSNEVAPEGSKTQDWEWRRSLKKYDLVDCYDRNTWYPSTICNVDEQILESGYKKITYRVGFRLYPKYFKNENDENDQYENYKCFWKTNKLELEEETKEEFYGDTSNCDENIEFYSKIIQKFQTYSKVQKEFLDQPTQYYAYGNNNTSNLNKIEKMNYELQNEDDNNGIIDGIYLYEKNGKKNYILGKGSNFSYYFALFLKRLADDNVFEEFINIINNKPNSEEILTIFYTLYYTLPYIHKKYLIENIDKYKTGVINFINNLNTKEIRSLPKLLIEVILRFIIKFKETLKLDNNDPLKNELTSLEDEIVISFSIKMIKTSIFDKRIQGIKKLNEFIQENITRENTMKIIIDLIQKNEIIKEIFGANYHSQIISKSDKILSLLLRSNEIKEEDIKLIWDCTQRGDLEAKSAIMKLLSDLAENLNENFINILLQNIINEFDKNKINEKEIDFIYNLSIQGDNENNKLKCIEYLYQCILKLDLTDNILKNPIMEKLIEFPSKSDKYLDKILSMCENDLKSNNSSLFVLQILSNLLNRYTFSSNEIRFLKNELEDFTKDDKLLILYKNNFENYIQRIKEVIKSNNEKGGVKDSGVVGNYDDVIVDNYTHVVNVQKRIEFLNDWITLIYPDFDFVPYLREILLDKPVSINDGTIFYEFMKKYISETKDNESDAKKEKKII